MGVSVHQFIPVLTDKAVNDLCQKYDDALNSAIKDIENTKFSREIKNIALNNLFAINLKANYPDDELPMIITLAQSVMEDITKTSQPHKQFSSRLDAIKQEYKEYKDSLISSQNIAATASSSVPLPKNPKNHR